MLAEVLSPKRMLAPLLVSRIKVMAKLDIAEKRIPQDGRMSLRVGGRVENPFTLTWDELLALPQVDDVSDFHCVTTWSRFDNRWKGVRFRTLAEMAVPKPEARFVLDPSGTRRTLRAFHGGYESEIPIVGSPLPP